MGERKPPQECGKNEGAAPSEGSPVDRKSASIPRSAREPEDSPGRALGRALREAAPHITAAWTLTAALLLGVLLGNWADRKWGVSPWLTLLGAVLGLAVGLYEVARVALKRRSGGGR